MWIAWFKFSRRANSSGFWHRPQALFGVQELDGDFVHPGTAPALDSLMLSHSKNMSQLRSSHFLGTCSFL